MMSNGSFKRLRYLVMLIVVLYLISTSSPTVLGEEQTISAGKRSYAVGEAVTFTGGGLDPNAEYVLQICYKDSIIQSIKFESMADGSLPSDLYWNSSSSGPGTYIVRLLDSVENVVAESTFGLIKINEQEFMPEGLIVVAGGGAEPYGTVNVTIVTDSTTIFNTSITADENGEFNVTMQLPFNITTGNYTVKVHLAGVGEVYNVSLPIFINATISNMVNVTAAELEDLIGLISSINITIKQSLLAKLQNALKKLEQAQQHLAHNRTHVAENMLNAAENILGALLNEVRAQRGKHLDLKKATCLNSSVHEIVGKLEAAKSTLDKPHKGAKAGSGEVGAASNGGKGGSKNQNGSDHGSVGKRNGYRNGKGHGNKGGKGRGKGRH